MYSTGYVQCHILVAFLWFCIECQNHVLPTWNSGASDSIFQLDHGNEDVQKIFLASSMWLWMDCCCTTKLCSNCQTIYCASAWILLSNSRMLPWSRKQDTWKCSIPVNEKPISAVAQSHSTPVLFGNPSPLLPGIQEIPQSRSQR